MNSKRKPNVIFFLTDQQRWDTSSLYGNPMDLTPNYDRMAMEGTHCYNAFTPQPVCLPARIVLQTGQYASRFQTYNNGGELPADEPTLGHWFRDAGYDTAYIGKWHMIHDDPVPPERRTGYDYWLGSNILEFTSDDYRFETYDGNGSKVRLPGYRVDAQTDAAISYIDDHQEKPFFMFLSYLEPHFQNHRDDYPAPMGYEEKYQNTWMPPDLQSLGGSAARHLPGYYGTVKRIDEALGRLRDALFSLGMLENTVIVYTTDHGCHFKTRNGEYKRSCHDSSIRIPMAFSGPGFQSGGRLQEMISLVDIPPTLLDACGIQVPRSMQGRSILALTRGQRVGWPEEVYSEICNERLVRAVRTKRWLYSVRYTEKATKPTNKWEFIEDELYDLKADPWQLNNCIHYKSHSKVRKKMCERLLLRMHEAGEPEPVIHGAETEPSGQKQVSDAEALM